MARIMQQIELYNLAYKLAWKHISEDQKHKQPNIAQRLHGSIRRHLKERATEVVSIAPDELKDAAVFIASDALKDVERS